MYNNVKDKIRHLNEERVEVADRFTISEREVKKTQGKEKIMRRMTKQTKAIVTEVNNYLKVNHIKDEGDTTFVVMQHALLRSNCYHGFNYYTEDGKLSGNTRPVDYINFYCF